MIGDSLADLSCVCVCACVYDYPSGAEYVCEGQEPKMLALWRHLAV